MLRGGRLSGRGRAVVSGAHGRGAASAQDDGDGGLPRPEVKNVMHVSSPIKDPDDGDRPGGKS